jgi:hypothetical protein
MAPVQHEDGSLVKPRMGRDLVGRANQRDLRVLRQDQPTAYIPGGWRLGFWFRAAPAVDRDPEGHHCLELTRRRQHALRARSAR